MRLAILILTISFTLNTTLIFGQAKNTFCCSTEPLQDMLKIVRLPESLRMSILPKICYDSGISKSRYGVNYTEFSKFCGVDGHRNPKLFSTFRFWGDGITTHVFSEIMFWSFYIGEVKKITKTLDEKKHLFIDSNYVYKFSKLPVNDSTFTYQLDIAPVKSNMSPAIAVRNVSSELKLSLQELIVSAGCSNFSSYENWVTNKGFCNFTSSEDNQGSSKSYKLCTNSSQTYATMFYILNDNTMYASNILTNDDEYIATLEKEIMDKQFHFVRNMDVDETVTSKQLFKSALYPKIRLVKTIHKGEVLTLTDFSIQRYTSLIIID